MLLPRSRESRFMLAIQVCIAAAVISLLLVQPAPGTAIVSLLTAAASVLAAAALCRAAAAVDDHVRVARLIRARVH